MKITLSKLITLSNFLSSYWTLALISLIISQIYIWPLMLLCGPLGWLPAFVSGILCGLLGLILWNAANIWVSRVILWNATNVWVNIDNDIK
jgi:hypothetical protein